MVVIVGGGIIGLSIGWELARAGISVTLLERGTVGHGATWAAAGILTAHAGMDTPRTPLPALMHAGHALWPEFVRDLEAASDVHVDYRTEGKLTVALDSASATFLKSDYDAQRRAGLPVEWLSGDEARRREPNLAPAVAAALFCTADHQVDNRRVAVALHEAFIRAGGKLREHAEVVEVIIERDMIQGVRLPHETLPADTVILAAGVWSRHLRGLPPGVRPPVRPVKGQMLALQIPPHTVLMRYIIWGPDAFLAPRSDGRLLVGATVEEAGFDQQPTAGGILTLLRGAVELCPATASLPIVEMWAGLRPGSPDNGPILGPTGIQGLIMATGHFRNGILLAPLTDQAISHLVRTGELPDVIKPFTQERFARALQHGEKGYRASHRQDDEEG